MKKIVFVAFLFLLTSPIAVFAAEYFNILNQDQEATEQIKAVVVDVHTNFKCACDENEQKPPNITVGTGIIIKDFIIAPEHIIKNFCSCLSKTSATYLINNGKLVYLQSPIFIDSKNDVALFKLPLEYKKKKLFAVEVGDSDKLKIGDLVCHMSFILNIITIDFGVINSLKGPDIKVKDIGNYDPESSFITSVISAPGDSGSPVFVFDKNRLKLELVGIVQRIFPFKGKSLVIKINKICHILKKNGYDICHKQE